MFRFVLSAVVVTGVFVTAQLTFADPVAATASGHVYAAAAATEQPAPTTRASCSSSSDAPAPVSAGGYKDTAPVGSGWG